MARIAAIFRPYLQGSAARGLIVETPALERHPFMFISTAYAQAVGGSPGGDLIGMILPLVLIMGVFWFLLIRPQQKKMKAHQEMIRNVRRGDTIVTSGGIIGKVARVIDDNEISVEVSEGLRLKFLKAYIAEVRVKGEPAKEPAKPAEGAKS